MTSRLSLVRPKLFLEVTWTAVPARGHVCGLLKPLQNTCVIKVDIYDAHRLATPRQVAAALVVIVHESKRL